MEFKSPDFGEMAYKAYGDYVEWKNFQGNPMPKWDELPEKIRGAWNAAAKHVMGIMNEYNVRTRDEN